MKTKNDTFGLKETSLLCDSETKNDRCSPCTALPTQPKNVNDEKFCKYEEIDIEISDNNGSFVTLFYYRRAVE